MVRTSAVSHPGIRSVNEDCYLCLEDPCLFVVARTAIGLANCRLVRESEGHDDCAGMGTTVVSALIAGSRLVVGHVGDSRLCNDGLHNVLDDDRLLALLTERESARETAQALVDEALAQGTRDNATALVVRYEGEA